MKRLSYILMVLVVMVLFCNNVSAKDYTVGTCKSDADCVILCSYNNSEGTTTNKSYIFYTNSDSSFYVYGYQKVGDNKAKNYLEKITATNDYMDETVFSKLKQYGTCPTYGYIKRSSKIELYYGKSQISNALGSGEKTYDKVSEISKYITANYYNCDNFNDVDVDDVESYLDSLNEKTKTYIKNKYFSSSWQSLPTFAINAYQAYTQESLTTVCQHDLVSDLKSGEVSQEEYNELSAKYGEIDEQVDYKKYITSVINQIKTDSDKYQEGAVNCKELIGANVIDAVNYAYKYVYIGVPILVIILGMIDFAKAVLESKEENMKKAQKNFIMRLIMGVAVFFVPTIINVIFGIINEASYSGGAENYFKYLNGASCVEDVID